MDLQSILSMRARKYGFRQPSKEGMAKRKEQARVDQVTGYYTTATSRPPSPPWRKLECRAWMGPGPEPTLGP